MVQLTYPILVVCFWLFIIGYGVRNELQSPSIVGAATLIACILFGTWAFLQLL